LSARRFISTLVLGSGLLFLGMVFVAAALGAAILTTYSNSAAFAGSETEVYVQFAFSQLFGVYALRIGGGVPHLPGHGVAAARAHAEVAGATDLRRRPGPAARRGR
jgi:hypothetical protein